MYKKVSVAAAVVCGALSCATTAVAAAPTGEYAEFSHCPYTNPAVETCIYAKTESGEVILGKKDVPITKTITLQGGAKEANAEEVSEFVGAVGAETLSKTPENVPGGLAGLINCQEIEGSGFLEKIVRGGCESVFEKGLTGVSATTELAGPPSIIRLSTAHLVSEKGIALKLPVKVHLENTLLGSECYVGSEASPLNLELTTGTTSPPPPNTPIKGSKGQIKINEEGTIVTILNNSLVNNSFSAPEASGCGGLLSFLIDPIIDSEIGLPSPSGHNTAILNGTLKSASAGAVVESTE